MEEKPQKLTGPRESKLWRRFARIVLAVVAKPDLFEEVAEWTRQLLARYAPDQLEGEEAEQEERQGPERDMAEERRVAMEAFYRGIGINITIPKPQVTSNREYRRRRDRGQELFFRLASSVLSYADFMIAVGQAGHWTVTHEDRNRIKWEDAAEGYWFWAEVQTNCPRLRTPWNTLMRTLKRLMSLEEYIIVWWERRQVGVILDGPTWSWVRNRYNFANEGEPERLGALGVNEYGGGVVVDGHGPGSLGVSSDGVGGRSAEVEKVAA